MSPEQTLIDALQTIPWFQDLDQEYFDELAKISKLIEVEAGVSLYQQGEKQDYVYIILNGRVAIEIAIPGKGRTRIYTAEPQEILGWSSVTPVVRQRTAGAVTVLPCTLIRMKASKLRKLCEKNHSLGYQVMRRIANVAASRLLVTRFQLLDIFAHANANKEGKHG